MSDRKLQTIIWVHPDLVPDFEREGYRLSERHRDTRIRLPNDERDSVLMVRKTP